MTGTNQLTDRLSAGTAVRPQLRKDINFATLVGLPTWSRYWARGGDVFVALRSADIAGVQARDPEQYLRAGFHATGMGKVMTPADAEAIARRHAYLGLDATTLHLGDGFETDNEIDLLVGATLEASAKWAHPMFLETHRATITQDMRRTLDMIERFPDVRFNADLSHWYTGQEMIYGDFAAKLDRLEPVFRRVRFLHGRIGDSGSMQRGMAPLNGAASIGHFCEMWRRCFRGFLSGAKPGDYLPFAVELLPAEAEINGSIVPLNYARLIPGEDGVSREESDRWMDAEELWRLADSCFDSEANVVLGECNAALPLADATLF